MSPRHGGHFKRNDFPKHPGCQNRGGTPVLTYFDVEGLAECVRVTFSIGGVHFIDRRVKDQEEFEKKYMGYAPTHLLPILEVDGKVISQSGAILRYAAERAGLIPEDPLDADRATAIHSILLDMMSFGDTLPRNQTKEARAAKFTEFVVQKMPDYFGKVESLVQQDSNGFLFGGRLSYVEVAFCTILRSMTNYVSSMSFEEICKTYPKIGAMCENVESHPAVIKYKASKENPKYRLHYFNGPGLAAPIRWAFKIGGIDFDDVRFDHSQWEAVKPTIPGGTVPALEIVNTGEWLSESTAILEHVAGKAGLVPRNELNNAHARSIVITAASIPTNYARIYKAENEEAKKLALETCQNETIPLILSRLDSLVGLYQSSQGYSVENRLSYADLYAAQTFRNIKDQFLGVVIPNIAETYPALEKVYQVVFSHPVVKHSVLSQDIVVKPSFAYFDLGARGEAFRQMFKWANIEFEDRRHTCAEWAETLKANTITGKAPYLDVGTTRIYECLGIYQYLAELTGLEARTWKGRAHSLAIYSCYNNCIDVMRRAYAKPMGPERDAVIVENRADFQTQLKIVEAMVKLYQADEGYVVDNQLSAIDFYIAYELDWAKEVKWIVEGWNTEFPALHKIYTKVLSMKK